MRLRSIGLGIVVVGALTLLVAGTSLGLLTTLLRRSTAGTVEAVNSLVIVNRLTELLAADAGAGSAPEPGRLPEIRDLLARAAGYLGSPDEREALDRLGSHLDGYLQSADHPGRAQTHLAAARSALRSLTEINRQQAMAHDGRAIRWDSAGDLIGGLTIVVVLVGGAAVLLTGHRLLRPASGVAAAIRRYGSGDRGARAPVEGAEDFRVIGQGFNTLAEALQREAERRMAFLAGVAHDMRNPLGALRLAVEAAAQSDAALPADRQRQVFGRVVRIVGRLERMLHDFLDSARIEAGVLELVIVSCDLRDVLRQAIELFEPGSPVHRLTVELPAAPVDASCDPMRIEQVVTNLVSNAIKYSPRGGEVKVSLRAEDGLAVIAVADQGLGISSGDLDQIFLPFSRRGSSIEGIPGVGLGLFAVQRIVRQHGGRVAVESSPGQGSTFRVALPLPPRRPAAGAVAPSDPAPRGQGE